MRAQGFVQGALISLLVCPPGCKGPGTPPPPLHQLPLQGAVVSGQPLATQVGLDILEAGGNAADAAVAAALALAVVLPQAGNLGGGGFALWVPHQGQGEVIDFREVTPQAFDQDLYLDDEGKLVRRRSLETPLAVGVPGSPAGLYSLFKRHGSGRFSFLQLCAPAISLAREGIPANSWLVRSLGAEGPKRRLQANPAARALFYPHQGGEALRVGDALIQEDLAQTLERYGNQGPQGFYQGQTAALLLDSLAEANEREGNLVGERGMTAADLTSYSSLVRSPLRGWFRGFEVLSVPPPSSGGFVLLQVLGILEGFPLEGQRTPQGEPTVRAMHWWIEAMRMAFADRAEHLGDPEDYAVPLDALLGADWVTMRRVSIGPQADLDCRAWVPPGAPESSQTTHLSVLDDQGNAVSLTTTLNATFGSGIMVKGGGFLLNNELDDFSIVSGTPNMFGLLGGEANQLRPGRRPLSSMTPTVVREGGGRVVLVLGAPGGPRIISSVLQVVLRVLVHRQDLESAVRAPRLHQQWRPKETRVEKSFDPELVKLLEATHGQPFAEGSAAGLIQAIGVGANGQPSVVSDPRSGGTGGLQREKAPR